jgi:hypothetical protein
MTTAEQAYGARLLPIVEAHRARQARHEKHPVIDFLFDYYTHRPAQLLRYSPGLGHAGVPPFPAERRAAAEWVITLLDATLNRPPQFGCHGLHEWAMVFAGEARRHDLPLRLPQAEIDAVVSSLPVTCTHFDAFRFFTPSARPLNRVPVTRLRQAEFDQPGCLHANMDLYKWAYKFQPWIPSELMADAFDLAMEIRAVDMRASPYDLKEYGCEPICIETPAGRLEYQRYQQDLSEKAQLLRARLLAEFRRLIEWVDAKESEGRPAIACPT